MGIEFYIREPKKFGASSEGADCSTYATDTCMMLNWTGWRLIEKEMDARRMIAWVDPLPEPDLKAVGWDGPCIIEALHDPTLPETAADAIDAWFEQQPDQPGIASFKLGNDGWVVTPAEIRSALARLEAQPPADVPNWDRWIAFLRRASDSGGIRVL